MPGARDPLYVLARRVLLDALEKLEQHRERLILVGAQAIYLHTGEAEYPAAEFTTDGDIAIDPSGLKPAPRLDQLLTDAGFNERPARGGKVDSNAALRGPTGRCARGLPGTGGRWESGSSGSSTRRPREARRAQGKGAGGCPRRPQQCGHRGP